MPYQFQPLDKLRAHLLQAENAVLDEHKKSKKSRDIRDISNTNRQLQLNFLRLVNSFVDTVKDDNNQALSNEAKARILTAAMALIRDNVGSEYKSSKAARGGLGLGGGSELFRQMDPILINDTKMKKERFNIKDSDANGNDAGTVKVRVKAKTDKKTKEVTNSFKEKEINYRAYKDAKGHVHPNTVYAAIIADLQAFMQKALKFAPIPVDINDIAQVNDGAIIARIKKDHPDDAMALTKADIKESTRKTLETERAQQIEQRVQEAKTFAEASMRHCIKNVAEMHYDSQQQILAQLQKRAARETSITFIPGQDISFIQVDTPEGQKPAKGDKIQGVNANALQQVPLMFNEVKCEISEELRDEQTVSRVNLAVQAKAHGNKQSALNQADLEAEQRIERVKMLTGGGIFAGFKKSAVPGQTNSLGNPDITSLTMSKDKALPYNPAETQKHTLTRTECAAEPMGALADEINGAVRDNFLEKHPEYKDENYEFLVKTSEKVFVNDDPEADKYQTQINVPSRIQQKALKFTFAHQLQEKSIKQAIITTTELEATINPPQQDDDKQAVNIRHSM